jgi:hypothetical protein
MRQFLRGLLGLGIGMSALLLFGAAVAMPALGAPSTQTESIPLVVLGVLYFVTACAVVWLLDWDEAPDWAYWLGLLLGAPPWIALFVFRDVI